MLSGLPLAEQRILFSRLALAELKFVLSGLANYVASCADHCIKQKIIKIIIDFV